MFTAFTALKVARFLGRLAVLLGLATAAGIPAPGLSTIRDAVVAKLPGFSADADPIPARYRAPLTDAINRLPVALEKRDGYDRDLFIHWIDKDGDGCDTRYEVLIEEALRAPHVGSGCYLSGGLWKSRYDGLVTTDPTDLEIDHTVALAEAWDSGAYAWSESRRKRYANDMHDKRALIAVTAHENQSKSDRDPGEWMPRLGRCSYVKSWVAVKLRWGLTVDAQEKQALHLASQGCQGDVVVRRAK